MQLQLTLIGLGEIGASVGLALRYQKKDIFRVGLDSRKSAEEAAKRVDAVDKIEHSYADAVKKAHLIVIAVPDGELEPVLDAIAPNLPEDIGILDFSLNKVRANRLARKYLPNPDQFVGLHAALSPARLAEAQEGWRSAREDLFKDGTLTIAATETTHPELLHLAQDFAILLGAHSAFFAPAEIDALTARSELAPKIATAAFSAAAFRGQGWSDQRKLGGKPFHALSGIGNQDETGLNRALELLANRENALLAIHEATAALKELRDALRDEDAERLSRFFDETSANRRTWIEQYEKAAWRSEAEVKPERTSMSETLSQFFLGGLLSGKKKN